MKTNHPNRLNKARGNKIDHWSRDCTPTTRKEKVELEQKINEEHKLPKKKSNKKDYAVFVKYDQCILCYPEGLKFKPRWSKHSSHEKERDALKAFDSCVNKKSWNGKDYYFDEAKIEFKGNIIKEFKRE